MVADAEQPHPHPLRRRGAGTGCEERAFELQGAVVLVHRWRYEGGWTRRDVKTTRTRHASRAAARAALEAAVAELVGQGWAPLPTWPELPADWYPSRDPAPVRAPPHLPPVTPPARPVALGRLRVEGTPSPVAADALARVGAAFRTATPLAWRRLLARLGPGTWAGRLRLPAPTALVRETRRVRRGFGEVVKLLVDRDAPPGAPPLAAEALVSLGSSIEGDQLVFVAGAPEVLLVLPRNADVVLRFGTLAEVFGHYAAVAARVDGLARPAYRVALTRGAPRGGA